MKGYKAFDADMKCRWKQYEAGQTYEEPEARLCETGIHFCEQPMAVLSYYPLVQEDGRLTRYAEVEAPEGAYTDEEKHKYVTKKLNVGAEIGIPGLIKAQVEYVRERAEKVEDGVRGNAAASGVSGNAAASGWSGNAAASGERGTAVVTGPYGKANASGKQCLAAAWGNDTCAKGAVGSWLVLTEFAGEEIKDAKLVKVDGKTIKADTFYRLVGGNLEEANDAQN